MRTLVQRRGNEVKPGTLTLGNAFYIPSLLYHRVHSQLRAPRGWLNSSIGFCLRQEPPLLLPPGARFADRARVLGGSLSPAHVFVPGVISSRSDSDASPTVTRTLVVVVEFCTDRVASTPSCARNALRSNTDVVGG
jgi:hypothetical protein